MVLVTAHDDEFRGPLEDPCFGEHPRTLSADELGGSSMRRLKKVGIAAFNAITASCALIACASSSQSCGQCLNISTSSSAVSREPGNDGYQLVRIDGLWHVDLEPSQ
jgi:hypothetical protein